MSEVPPPPEPAPAPAPDATPDAPRRPGRAPRLAILGGIAAVVIALAIVLVARTPRPSPLAVVAQRDGGAAVRAPQGPGLPGVPDGPKLSGVVVDGAGIPVAGAEVTAEPEQGFVDRALAGAPRDAGPAAAIDAGVAVGSPTGADGRFLVGGLEPGRFRLRVTGAGLLAAELRMIAVPSDDLRIVVARQVGIAGTVTDGGRPVPSATVGIRGDAIGGTLETKTDSQGKFDVANLPEGRYQVYAYRGALAARAVRVARLGAGPFPAVDLRLEAAQNVVGRVIDRDEGTGLVAAIELRPVGDDQAPRFARSGVDGSFMIEGVPNGRWIADAYAPGYLSPGGVELEAGNGIPELALAPGATIEGRVLDSDGRPVEGATVRALTSGKSRVEISALVEQDQLRRFSGRTAAPVTEVSSFTGDPQFIPRGELGVTVGPIPPIPPPGAIAARPAAVIDPTTAVAQLAGEPPPLEVEPDRASIWTTGRDGRFRIRGLAKSKLSVLALAGGYAEARSRDVSVSPGQVLTGVDIVLSAGTFVFGKVTDPRGAPVAGARVNANPEVGTPIDAFTDDDGMYRLGPLTGKVQLVASAYGHVEARRTVELVPTKGHSQGQSQSQGQGRSAAERREDLVLEVADAIFAGTLDDAAGAVVAGAQLEVTSGAGQGRQTISSADGTFSIDGLPRGRLRVRVIHPAYPASELDGVASTTGERARLRLPLGGQVEGVLLDLSSGNPLAGMTVDGHSASGDTAEASTNDKGLWKLGPLRPGLWRLSVRLPGYLPFSRDLDVPVARAPGQTSVRDIRIELARGALLGGTVRDRRGQRMSGAHITARRADGAGEPVEADADAQGEFRIHDCPTGELLIGAQLGDAEGSTRATVRPGDEILSLSIELR